MSELSEWPTPGSRIPTGKTTIPVRWEKLDNTEFPKGTYANTWRMKVPGGWLIRVSEMCTTGALVGAPSISTAVVFVSDPQHGWDIR